MDFDKLRFLFAKPSGASWHQIQLAGNNLMKHTGVFADSMRLVFHQLLRDELKKWPPELCRRVPADWPDLWRECAEYLIREVDTYGYYESGVCGHPHLRTDTGHQAVRLARRFVGAARSFSSDKRMQIGLPGEADLQGGITLEFRRGDTMRCLECSLAVEVKTPDGSLNPDQKKWRDAVIRRGAIYVVATTVLEAVEGIKKARDEKLYQIAYG